MQPFIADLWRDEGGQDLVEYVLLVVLIAVAAIAAMTTLGNKAEEAFWNATFKVDSAVS